MKREWWEPIPSEPMDVCVVCGTHAAVATLVDVAHRSPGWTYYDPQTWGKFVCADEFECLRRQHMNMRPREVVA